MKSRLTSLGSLLVSLAFVSGCGGEPERYCNDVFYQSTITIERPLAVSAEAIAGITFELCVSGSCRSTKPVDRSVSLDGFDALDGEISEAASGFSFFGRLVLGERRDPTPLSVRASAADGSVLFVAEAELLWIDVDEGCGKRANRTTL